MKQRDSQIGFGCGSIFGLVMVSENNSDSRKILEHFNAGFKLRHVHDEDCTDTEMVQNNFL